MLQKLTTANLLPQTVANYLFRLRSMMPELRLLPLGIVVVAFLVLISQATLSGGGISRSEQDVTSIQLIPTVSSSTELPQALHDSAETQASVRVEGSFSTSAASPSVELKVNGQEIAIPENGQADETVPVNDQSGVRVQITSSTSDSSENEDKTRIKIESESESEVKVKTKTSF